MTPHQHIPEYAEKSNTRIHKYRWLHSILPFNSRYKNNSANKRICQSSINNLGQQLMTHIGKPLLIIQNQIFTFLLTIENDNKSQQKFTFSRVFHQNFHHNRVYVREFWIASVLRKTLPSDLLT